jgi:hypothetical protein
MKVKGREDANWGYRIASAGYHIVEIQDGVEFTLDEQGARKSLLIPVSVNEGSDDDGVKIAIFAPANHDFGEQKVADILAAVGLFAAFEEKFPGDVSFFDKGPFEALKAKLPGQFLKVLVEISKDGKYNNVLETHNVKYEGKAAAGPAKGAAKSNTAKAW